MDIGSSNMDSGSVFANRYKIDSLLGAGGMGKVFLAHDLILNNEKIALKILHGDIGSNDALKQRFIREVQLTRKVTHPNVVRTFDVGVEQEKLYFTMELVTGKTLKEKITGEPLDPQEATKILIELCEGLSAIHALDIVHRDLKSSNVIIDANGHIKITDFGVARPGNSELTQTDELLGSATHIAPESWKDGSGNQMTDIYALGIIAYELITGILPFDGKSPHELMFKHLKQRPVEPIEINPHVPRWLNSLVMRMLEKSPSLRPPSAESIINEIKTKIRRSTVEDARANLEALSENGEAAAPSPLGYEQSEEGSIYDIVDEDTGEELDEDSPRIRTPTVELPPLERVSFTAQPAALEMTDGEAATPPLPISSTSFVIEALPALMAITRDIIAKSALAVIGVCAVLYLAGQFPETWILAPTRRHPLHALTVSLGSLLLVALLLVMPFLPLLSLHKLKEGERNLLRPAFIGSCLIVLALLAPHLIRYVYWSAGLEWADFPKLIKSVSVPAVVNGLELATLTREGSQYRAAFFEDRTELIPAAVWLFERQIFYYLAWFGYAFLAGSLLVRHVLSLEKHATLLCLLAASFLLVSAECFTLLLRGEAFVGPQLIGFQFGFSEIKVSFASILGAMLAWASLVCGTLVFAVLADYRIWRRREE